MGTDFKAAAIARSKRFAEKNPGTAELRRFVQSFAGKFPKELARELRPLIKATGTEMLSRTQANANWSNRIPGSLRLTVSLSKRSAGLLMTSNRRLAPHGRPLNNMGKSGTIRHPVNPSRTAWGTQPARPWFFNAADELMTRKIDDEIGSIIDRVSRSHGFR